MRYFGKPDATAGPVDGSSRVGSARVLSPSSNTMQEWRAWYWQGMPIVQELGRVQGLLAHSASAASHFMGMHEIHDLKKRVERVVSVCASRSKTILGWQNGCGQLCQRLQTRNCIEATNQYRLRRRRLEI